MHFHLLTLSLGPPKTSSPPQKSPHSDGERRILGMTVEHTHTHPNISFILMCVTGVSCQRRRAAPVLPVPPRQRQIPQADQGAGGEERRAPHRDGTQGGQAGHPGVPPPPGLQRHRSGPGRHRKCLCLTSARCCFCCIY